jgi:hypothetical protein
MELDTGDHGINILAHDTVDSFVWSNARGISWQSEARAHVAIAPTIVSDDVAPIANPRPFRLRAVV